ncbi:3559_t:CDS:2 [Gigaspora rosea]|nr:3559_t:CDS:2 [Gigaspora rosea]
MAIPVPGGEDGQNKGQWKGDQSKEYTQDKLDNKQQANGNNGLLAGINNNVQPNTKANICDNQAGVGVVGVNVGNKCQN